jgi:polysaccharide export outer membrane protein
MKSTGAVVSGIFCLLAGVLAIGCSTGPTVKADAAAAAAAPEANPEYHIGPGDTLNVFVWNHPELSVKVPVRPDGVISTPLVENMPAAGKAPSELARAIEERLKEYVRTPKVNVIVESFVGALTDQIRVVGQAMKPQSLPYRANLTVLDVMIQVGGLAPYAAGNRAKLVRKVDGKNVEMPVRLNDLLNKGDVNANVAMRPGDVLIIPESRF